MPTDKEWTTLFDNYRGEGEEYKVLTQGVNNNFSSLLGGERGNYGEFGFLSKGGHYWSATVRDANHAWFYFFSSSTGRASQYDLDKRIAFSCRCLKD